MKTILITGVSSGLGRAMAEAALGRGHRVVGTLRDEDQRRAFETLAPGRSFGRLLDVTGTAAGKPLVQAVEAEVGPIDVLINNAGYGLRGAVEELEPDALRRQFDVNVFAPVVLIQAVLPAMRARRRGHIVNVSSMGGMVAFPGLGAYHGTKFALLGLSDSLAQEVAPLGIHVTAVLPGFYRSDWGGRSLARSEHPISDYEAVTTPRTDLPWGNPAKLGEAVADMLVLDLPPQRLLVGPNAVRIVRARLAELSTEIDRWESLSEAGGEG